MAAEGMTQLLPNMKTEFKKIKQICTKWEIIMCLKPKAKHLLPSLWLNMAQEYDTEAALADLVW